MRDSFVYSVQFFWVCISRDSICICIKALDKFQTLYFSPFLGSMYLESAVQILGVIFFCVYVFGCGCTNGGLARWMQDIVVELLLLSQTFCEYLF